MLSREFEILSKYISNELEFESLQLIGFIFLQPPDAGSGHVIEARRSSSASYDAAAPPPP